jgi:hypothetical protein
VAHLQEEGIKKHACYQPLLISVGPRKSKSLSSLKSKKGEVKSTPKYFVEDDRSPSKNQRESTMSTAPSALETSTFDTPNKTRSPQSDTRFTSTLKNNAFKRSPPMDLERQKPKKEDNDFHLSEKERLNSRLARLEKKLPLEVRNKFLQRELGVVKKSNEIKKHHDKEVLKVWQPTSLPIGIKRQLFNTLTLNRDKTSKSKLKNNE